ncbi:MAG: hypothetical protein KDD60_08535, partial [Bdellovibrionales bacterium]|nr:hypothetical protein [Bdellovibrionales bacterium]
EYGETFSRLLSQLLEPTEFKISLSHPNTYIDKVSDADLLILGSDLAELSSRVATEFRDEYPDVPIFLFVDPTAYSAGSFQIAYQLGVRKVLSDSASTLDLLQEIVAIQSELCRSGKIRQTEFIVVRGVSGGVGASSLVAALGEVCSDHRRRVLLWDMDVETRDLTRALRVEVGFSEEIDHWLSRPEILQRDSFIDGLAPLTEYAQLLVPPASRKQSLQLLWEPEGLCLLEKIIGYSRFQYDTVIIDIGTATGNNVNHILRSASKVLLVLGDTPFSIAAADEYLHFYGDILGSSKKVYFLPTSDALSISTLRKELDPVHRYGQLAWALPPLLYDIDAQDWPGKLKTLYSLGSHETQVCLEKIARGIGALPARGPLTAEDSTLSSRFMPSSTAQRSFIVRTSESLKSLVSQPQKWFFGDKGPTQARATRNLHSQKLLTMDRRREQFGTIPDSGLMDYNKESRITVESSVITDKYSPETDDDKKVVGF